MNDIIFETPVFICAGEPSGDLYAGLLANNLKKNSPELKIYGVGGEEMRRSGVEVLIDYQGLMTFGFSNGIFSIFRHYRVYKKIAQEVYRAKPKTFIAVAYPGINLLLCQYARKMGCDVYYFLPPQIWAWGGFRRYFIKKWVDMVISVFPFEHAFYKKIGIETIYLENPLFKMLKEYRRNDFSTKIGLMPGSRLSEIKRNFPVMLELVKKINREKQNTEFCLIMPEDLIGKIRHPNHDLKTITQNRHQAMKNCDFLITCSGTASLEAAIMGIPQIFFNRPSVFDYYLFRRFLKIKEYNLANLYFEKKFVPSLVAYNKNYLLQNLDELLGNIRIQV